jgi:hypothetical protein
MFRSYLGLFHQIEHLVIHGCRLQADDIEPTPSHATTQHRQAGSNSGNKRALRSFEWALHYYSDTQDLGLMYTIDCFDLSRLEVFSLTTIPINWAPILLLCQQARDTLRELHISYFYNYPWSGMYVASSMF